MLYDCKTYNECANESKIKGYTKSNGDMLATNNQEAEGNK